MFILYLIVVALAVFGLLWMRHDHWFSPGKFLLMLVIVYVIAPVTMTGMFDFGIDRYGHIFPSLYDEYSLLVMLLAALISLLVLFLLRAFTPSTLLQNFNNTDLQPQDDVYAVVGWLFCGLALGFLGLAISRVGLEAYSTYTVEATIGGDRVAQSFKSQGELMLALFSLPLLKRWVRREQTARLLLFLAVLVGLSALGGARKFLVLPFITTAVLWMQYYRPARAKLVLGAFMFVLVIVFVQVVREGREMPTLDFIISPFLQQMIYAFVVPSSFAYYYGENWLLADFDLGLFLLQTFVYPVIYATPRFLLPNKDELLLSMGSVTWQPDFHTVGGSSYIEFFLQNSLLALVFGTLVIYGMVWAVFMLCQRYRSSLLLYFYLAVLIHFAWFSYNWGYLVVAKTFLSQTLFSLLLFEAAAWLLFTRTMFQQLQSKQ